MHSTLKLHCTYIAITLQLRYIARATHWRYTVVTLKLRYIARATHWRYTVITLKSRYIARATQVSYFVITLHFHLKIALPYMHSTMKLHLKMALPCTRCTVKLHLNFNAIALKLHYTRKTARARLHSLHCNYAQCTRYNGRATQGYDFWWLLTRSKARSLTLHLCFNARELRYT